MVAPQSSPGAWLSEKSEWRVSDSSEQCGGPDSHTPSPGSPGVVGGLVVLHLAEKDLSQ